MQILRVLFICIFALASNVIKAELSSGTVPHNHSSTNAGGNNLNVTGNVAVGGTTSLNGNVTTNNLNVGGTLTTTGNTSLSTLDISGTVTSTKACETGYVRVGTNFCKKDLVGSYTALTRDTCTGVAISVNAKVVLVQLSIAPASANVAGVRRFTSVAFSRTNTCAQHSANAEISAYEFVATPATYLAQAYPNVVTRTDSGGSIYMYLYDDVGNGGVANYAVVGYWD